MYANFWVSKSLIPSWMVEWLNKILKVLSVNTLGTQWDHYLSSVLWAYRNTSHESTKEKPSYLLFRTDYYSPTEAPFSPWELMEYINVEEYREELVLLLSSTRERLSKRSSKFFQCYDISPILIVAHWDLRTGHTSWSLHWYGLCHGQDNFSVLPMRKSY